MIGWCVAGTLVHMRAHDHGGGAPKQRSGHQATRQPEDAEHRGSPPASTRPHPEAIRLTVPGVLALQQTAGNTAVVQRMNTPKVTGDTDEKQREVAPERKDETEPEVAPSAPAEHNREELDAAHADQAIQFYLELAPREGGGVEGAVTLCDENEFAMAMFKDMAAVNLKEMVAKGMTEPVALETLMGLASSSAGKVHAFNGSSDRHIYLKAGSVDQGVLIHEGVHKYDNPAFVDDLCGGASNGINEGVTEYFARWVTDALGWSRNAYDSEMRTVQSLVTALGANGPQLLKAAYFDGALNEFRHAYHAAIGVAWDADLAYLQTTARGGGPVVTMAHRFEDSADLPEGGLGSLFD